MSQKKISSGVVHEVPADLKKAFTSDPQALAAWEDISRFPLVGRGGSNPPLCTRVPACANWNSSLS
jgi:hypothetical protein